MRQRWAKREIENVTRREMSEKGKRERERVCVRVIEKVRKRQTDINRPTERFKR